MSGARVVVVGSYNQDLVWRVDRFPQPGETRRGMAFISGPGGKGFNQAIACLRQDVGTAFIGAVGADALGDGARQLASREGLDARWLIREDVATGTCGITVDAHGQNQIVLALAANEKLDASFITAQANLFADARVLLVQMENNIDAIATALKLAGDHGVLRVLNPAPVHPDLDADTLARADVLTPNEGEFATLCERFLGVSLAVDTIASMDDLALHQLARRFGDGTFVVTLGSHGCFVSHGSDRRGDNSDSYRLPAEHVQPVDTTGAGDAFNGALAASLAADTTPPFRDALRYATRVAAISTERPGAAAAMPTRADVMSRFS
jgi:ribokinase